MRSLPSCRSARMRNPSLWRWQRRPAPRSRSPCRPGSRRSSRPRRHPPRGTRGRGRRGARTLRCSKAISSRRARRTWRATRSRPHCAPAPTIWRSPVPTWLRSRNIARRDRGDGHRAASAPSSASSATRSPASSRNWATSARRSRGFPSRSTRRATQNQEQQIANAPASTCRICSARSTPRGRRTPCATSRKRRCRRTSTRRTRSSPCSAPSSTPCASSATRSSASRAACHRRPRRCGATSPSATANATRSLRPRNRRETPWRR